MDNIVKVLKAAGSGMEYVAKVNIYLTDLENSQAMGEVYTTVRHSSPLDHDE